MSRAEQLVEQVRTWIDVPYRDKGRNRFGIDCIGVLIKAAHEVGFTTYDTLDYPRRPSVRDFLRGMRDNLSSVPKAEATHGDIVVFRDQRERCHVAILDRDARHGLHMIHAYAPARKVIREAVSPARWDSVYMAFRVPEEAVSG